MTILKRLAVRNFKCIRSEISVQLDQGTYLVGPNNAGKTAILQAINCYFNSEAFDQTFLNQTEFTRRQAGFNRSDITIEFDLSVVSGRVRKERIQATHGETLVLTKSFTWKEQSDTISISYTLSGNTIEYDQLDADIRHLLSSIAVSYIHPQEGAELLRKAQEKFKQRLFHNWGRHASVAERLTAIQQQWEQLRNVANSYLSRALTDRIRQLWPGSEVKIDLPARVEDVVAISDIAFRGGASLPEVSLTAQGTGAQSAILYQTHFLLDSDRSLHPGMYFPIWLLEEPESFLHADIAFQLGRLLASDEWQNNIQMVISTHSPIILAGSHQNPNANRWVLFDRHQIASECKVEDATDDIVDQIGSMMGDSNFGIYFQGASLRTLVFLEDSRALTRTAFINAGIDVTKSLAGIGDVKKYLDVYCGVRGAAGVPAFFIVDGDKGLREIQPRLNNSNPAQELNGWKKHELHENVYLIVLPESCAVEDLFDEWDQVLEETVDDLLDASLAIRNQVPARLSRIVDVLRRRPPQSRDEAKSTVSSQQDAKDRFWTRVEENSWNIAAVHSTTVRTLLGMENH